jgi:hypothetical protein
MPAPSIARVPGDETDLRNGDFVLFHVSFNSFNRNSNPSQMGRRQAVSRRFQFPKCSQLFIGAHNWVLVDFPRVSPHL